MATAGAVLQDDRQEQQYLGAAKNRASNWEAKTRGKRTRGERTYQQLTVRASVKPGKLGRKQLSRTKKQGGHTCVYGWLGGQVMGEVKRVQTKIYERRFEPFVLSAELMYD